MRVIVYSLMNRYLGFEDIYKYEETTWTKVHSHNGRYGASLVLSNNTLLLVGGGPDKAVRYMYKHWCFPAKLFLDESLFKRHIFA